MKEKILLRLFSILFPVKEVRTERERKAFTNAWYSVWLEEEYTDSDEPIVEKYAKYDDFSTDLLVKFMGIIPAGTMRIIKDNEKGLPTINDFDIKEGPWKESRVSEVTLLTVSKRFRKRTFKGLTFAVLMKVLYKHIRKNNLRGIVIAADKRLFYSLTKRIKLPFSKIGEGKFYEGSITIPAYMDMQNFDEIFAQNNPLIFDFVFR